MEKKKNNINIIGKRERIKITSALSFFIQYIMHFIEDLEEKSNEIEIERIAYGIHNEKIERYMIIKLKLFNSVTKFLKLLIRS